MLHRPRSAVARGILSIWNDFPAEQEDFYERWYMGEHFPERLGVPGFIRGRRYEAIAADRRYFTCYELDTPEVMFSAPYLARLNDPTAWTTTVMGSWRSMFRTVCERVRRRGDAVGGFAIAARWEAPVELPLDLADRVFAALDDPGIVAVDTWRAFSSQNSPTKEAAMRAEPDRFVNAVLLIETTRERSIAAAKDRLKDVLPSSPLPQAVGAWRLIALQDAVR